MSRKDGITTRGRRWKLAGVGLMTMLASTQANAASAYMDNVRLEGDFVKALCDSKLLDFAETQLNLMKAAFPKEKDLILIYEAEFLIGKGQKNSAAKLLAGVPKSSPYFADIALKRGDLSSDAAEKAKAYASYFEAFPNPPKSGRALEIWKDAIFKRFSALIAAGDAKKAQQVLELTKKLPEEMQYNPRMLTYLQAQAVFKLADRYLDQKKSTGSLMPQIKKARKDIEGLLWAGADAIAALAYGELAHAQVLMGEEDAAIKTANDATKLLKQVEEAFIAEIGKQSGMAASPVPSAVYYVGEAYMSKARKTRGSNKDATVENLKKAIQSFYTVASGYRQHPLATRASDRVNTIKTVLKEKYDVTVDLKGGEEQKMLLDSAKQAYMRKEYKQAGDLFLQASSADLRGSAVAESLKFSVVSLYRQKRYLEAIAIGDFLYDWYRRSPETASALYNLGVTLYKESKTEATKKDPVKLKELSDYSNLVFSRFVRAAPRDPKTPKVALRCADYEYNKGIAARDKKNEVAKRGDVKKTNEAIVQMRETFKEAVPLYEILTEHFGSTPQAIKAYSKLGWIYHIIDEPVLSAENFLEFVALTEQPNDEKAQAKFFAAERYMRAKDYDKAITHFDELLAWTGPGGEFKKKSEKVTNYRNSSEGMVLWCSELKRLGMNKTIEELKKTIAKLEAGGADAEPAKDAPKPEGDEPAPQTIAEELAEAKTQLAALVKQEEILRQKALTGFTAFVEKHPKDPQTPSNLMKLGVMRMEAGEEQEAVKWLERLKKEHPESDAAKQAAFTLGKALIDAGKWDRASSAFADATSKFPEMAYSNLNYISAKLYRDAERTEKGLSAEVVLAANREIEKRSNDPNNPDYATIKPRRERLMFRIAECLLETKSYEDAVNTYDRVISEAKVDNPDGNTKYYYEVLFGKGRAYRALGESDRALRQYDEALTYIPTDKEPVMYAMAIMESADSLLQKKDYKHVGKAASRFKQLIFFLGPSENEKVFPYLEQAYFEGAKALSLLGLKKDAEKLQAEYKKKFPKGQFRQKILVLPAQEYSK